MTDLIRYPIALLRPVYERSSFHRSVIDEVDDAGLQSAYLHCRAITREHAKTFYMATRFLPNHKQRSIFAIYALCRHLDDLVDEAEDLVLQQKLACDDILHRIDQWKDHLEETYRGYEHDHPVLLAFADVLRNYDISIDLPFALIDGVCMDLTKKRYETFEELYDYSYKVASIVGLMTSEVFGYEDPAALKHAVDLGIAMQLTNILRDVGEDLGKGRIYLPLEERERFGVTEQKLFNGVKDRHFREMMEFNIKRAEHYYESADRGIALLSPDSRLPVSLARENYSRILNRIRDNHYDVFKQRAYLGFWEKLSVLPRAWWQSRG